MNRVLAVDPLDIFTHGHLYVETGRVKDPKNFKYCTLNNAKLSFFKNIVYPDFIQKCKYIRNPIK